MSPAIRVCAFLLVCTTCFSTFAYAQQLSPDVASVVRLSNAALNTGITVADVQLTGTAKWIAGSTVASGPVTLQWKGAGQSRIDLPAAATVASELRNDTAGVPDGEFIRPDGKVVRIPLHNCLTAPAWFSPLAVIAWFQRPDAVVTYLGTDTVNNATAIHLRLRRGISGKTIATTNLLQKLTTTDVYLDAKTYVPLSLRFTEHPEDDATKEIAVEVRFSDYRNVSGVAVPFHIQRLRQNSLNLDITISSAVVNPGLADTLFALQ